MVISDKIVHFDVFEAYEMHFKDKVAEAYDEAYLEALKDDALGFTHVTVREMIEHLQEQCLALTVSEKKKKLRLIEIDCLVGDDIRVSYPKSKR